MGSSWSELGVLWTRIYAKYKEYQVVIKFSIWKQRNPKGWNLLRLIHLLPQVEYSSQRQSPLHAGLMFWWLIVLCRLNFPWFVSIVCGRTTDCSPRQYFSEKSLTAISAFPRRGIRSSVVRWRRIAPPLLWARQVVLFIKLRNEGWDLL